MATRRKSLLIKVASLLGKDKKADSPVTVDVDEKHFQQQQLNGAHQDVPQLRPVATSTPSISERPCVSKQTTAGPKEEATEFFFARIPSTVTYEQLLAVFSSFGTVVEVNLFKPFAEAKTSKGCGIVRFATAAAAAAAKAQLHEKFKWAPDYAPMVLEHVNAKKKRSNISNDGATELIFTPKFMSSKKCSSQQHELTAVQGHAAIGTSCSAQGPDLQRRISQNSCCSSGSNATCADGVFSLISSRGTNSTAGRVCSIIDIAAAPDRACGRPLSSSFTHSMADPAFGSISSSSNSGPGFSHAAPGAAAVPARLADSRAGEYFNPGLAHLGQHQLLDQQWYCGAPQHSQQTAWPQLQLAAERVPAAGLDELRPAASAGLGVFSPSFRPMQHSSASGAQQDGQAATAAMVAAAAARAAVQPTSLSILGAGQPDDLGMPLAAPTDMFNKLAAAGVAWPQFASGFDGGLVGPAALGLLAMKPAAAGDECVLPFLPPAFSNNECFSTYSNLLDGCPSMQLAQTTHVSTSGHFASVSAAANYVAEASLGCTLQQQQQHALQSGSNLQLTTGAMYRLPGGAFDGCTDDINSLQQQHLLRLDGCWPTASSSGYFDLFKSSSSDDSPKGDDTTGISSGSSCANKLSSCCSSDMRTGNTCTPELVAALARQQQDRLLSMQEQQQLQRAGPHAASHVGAAQLVPLCPGTNGAQACDLFAGAMQGAPAPAHQRDTGGPLHWQQRQQMLQAGSHTEGPATAMPRHLDPPTIPQVGHTGRVERDEGTVTVELPAAAQAVSVVVEHIQSITALTGAAVLIDTAAGQLSLKLMGTPDQVKLATNIVELLLRKQQGCV